MEDSFYLTLLSSSSTLYFPNNTTSNFFTKLPKTLKLEGEWVVGLVEFNYPCTMFNVQEHENIFYVTKKEEAHENGVEYTSNIPTTNYDNIAHFLQSFNENNLLKGKISFEYNEISKLVTISSTSDDILEMKLTPKLCLQLGFEPNINIIEHKSGKYPMNLNLGLPSQLFIYSDIVQPQIVGDVMTPLLRIVSLDPMKYTYGAFKMNVFSPAHYLPVMRREFDVIEIDIRTNIGDRVPFQFGTACIKLHFKRIK